GRSRLSWHPRRRQGRAGRLQGHSPALRSRQRCERGAARHPDEAHRALLRGLPDASPAARHRGRLRDQAPRVIVMAKPVVYGPAYSTYTRTCRLALEEKGADYDLVEVDIFSGANTTPEHLARHPFGKVPAFAHDGLELY